MGVAMLVYGRSSDVFGNRALAGTCFEEVVRWGRLDRSAEEKVIVPPLTPASGHRGAACRCSEGGLWR